MWEEAILKILKLNCRNGRVWEDSMQTSLIQKKNDIKKFDRFPDQIYPLQNYCLSC